MNPFKRLFSGVKQLRAKRNMRTFMTYMGQGNFRKMIATNRNAYDNMIVKPTINRIASDMGSVVFNHYLKNDKFKKGRINWLLNTRPNVAQSPFDFKVMIATQLLLNSNAFVLMDFNKNDPTQIDALIPIDYNTVEIFEDANRIFVKFRLRSGEARVVLYDEIIHLRRFYRSGLYGERTNNDLQPTIDLILTNQISMTEAINSNGSLKGLLTINTVLDEEILKATKNNWVADYLNTTNTSGVGALDAKMSFTELKNDYTFSNEKQMLELRETIYQYYNVNKKIIEGTANEQEWLMYHQLVIEPIARSMEEEFSYKIFTDKRLEAGHRIKFSSNKLAASTLSAKTNYYNMVLSTGMLSLNEVREMEDLPPVPGGDINRVNLNNVNITLADQYQADRARSGPSKN